jgi:hypothetical protein
MLSEEPYGESNGSAFDSMVEAESGFRSATRGSGPSYWTTPLLCLFLAGMWFIFGSLAALKSAWPTLALILLLAWTGVTFERYAFEMYHFLPRTLRLQFALEFSIFWWQELLNQPNQRCTQTLRHVRIALRAARGTPLHSRVARIAKRLEHGNDLSDVAPDLQACLQDLALGTRSAVPFRHRPLLPFAAVPLASIFAFATLLAWKLLTNAPALTRPDAVFGLTLLLLYVVTFRLVLLLHLKFQDVHRKIRLRILYLTDEELSDQVNQTALDFYGRIGHVIAIFANGSVRAEWRPICGPGAYVFTPSAKNARNVIEAFVRHADLIVLRSDDPALAATLRSVTSLPQDRRFAIRTEGAVPPGFVCLEAQALRMTRSESVKALNDALSADLRPAVPLEYIWRPSLYLWLYPWLASCAALLWFEHSNPLLALLCLAGIGGLFSKLLYWRRRTSVSRTVLRVPKMCSVSRRLRPARLEGILSVMALALIAAAGAHVHWHEPGRLLRNIWVTLILTAAALQGYTGLVWGGMIAVKWILDWNFRIAVFRRNSVCFGFGHKFVIMATCGRYGQVIALRDDELERTDEGFGEWRESSKGKWLPIFSEMNALLEPEVFRWLTKCWRATPRTARRYVDFWKRSKAATGKRGGCG